MSEQPQQTGRFSAADVDAPPKMGRFSASDVDAPAAPKPGWETFKANMGQTGSVGDYLGKAAHMLTAPVTGLLGVPGEVADFVKRGFRNRNLEEGGMPAGNTGEDPVSQMIGAASMALLPPDLASARDAAGNAVGTAATAGKGFVKGGFEAGKTAARSPMNYVGTSAAEFLAGQLGIPHGVATAISEGAQIAHGGLKGAKAAVAAERVAAAAKALQTPPEGFGVAQGSTLPGQIPPSVNGPVGPQVPVSGSLPGQVFQGPPAPPLPDGFGVGQGSTSGPIPAAGRPVVGPQPPVSGALPGQFPAPAPRPPMSAAPASEPMAPGRTIQEILKDDLAAKRAPAPADTAAVAAPAEDMAMLDGIAQSLNGTSFAKASPASQATIRTLASRLDQPVPADQAAAPVQTRAPYQPPEPSAPSKSLQQLIQDDLAAKRATTPQNVPGARPPQTPDVVATGAPQPTERQPAPAATQATQAPVPPEVNRPETQPVLEQAGRSGYTATGEVKSPQLRLQEKIGSARAKNAGELAKTFHDSGISLEAAKTIKLDDPVWKEISDSLGQKKRPSKETVEATLMELGRLSKK